MVPEGVCDYLQEEAHAFTETGEDSIDITDPFFRDLLSDTTIEVVRQSKDLERWVAKRVYKWTQF